MPSLPRATVFTAIALAACAPAARAAPEVPDAGASLQSAASLVSGSASGELSTPSDVDVYAVQVAYGGQVRLNLSAAAAPGDPAANPACGRVSARLIDSASTRQAIVAVDGGDHSGTGLTFVNDPALQTGPAPTPWRLAVVEVTAPVASGCGNAPRGYDLGLTSTGALSAPPTWGGSDLHEISAGAPADSPAAITSPGITAWRGSFDTVDDVDTIPLGTAPAGTHAVVRLTSMSNYDCGGAPTGHAGSVGLTMPEKGSTALWDSSDILWPDSLIEDPLYIREGLIATPTAELPGGYRSVVIDGYLGRAKPLTLSVRASGCVNFDYWVSVQFEPVDGAPLCARQVVVDGLRKQALRRLAKAKASLRRAHRVRRGRRVIALHRARHTLGQATRHARTLADAAALANAECRESSVYRSYQPPTLGAS